MEDCFWSRTPFFFEVTFAGLTSGDSFLTTTGSDLTAAGGLSEDLLVGQPLPFVLVWVLVFDVPGVAGLEDPVVAVRAALLLRVLLPVATLAGLASSVVLSTSVGPPAADSAVVTTREVTFCGIEFSAQTPDSVWFIFL